MHVPSPTVLAVVLFAAVSASAESGDAPRDASACPAIFGDATTSDAVRARRASAIESMDEDRYGVVLFHHVGRWGAPKVASLAGVTLLDVDRAQERLTFDVAVDLAGCERGRYTVDDAVALGRDGVVVAALADGVLVEKQRQLTFMPVSGRRAPRFRLVWRSPYSIVRDAPATGASVAPGGKRPTASTSAALPKVDGAKAEAPRRSKAPRAPKK